MDVDRLIGYDYYIHQDLELCYNVFLFYTSALNSAQKITDKWPSSDMIRLLMVNQEINGGSGKQNRMNLNRKSYS